MRILLVEPFYGGSHKSWALGLQKALSCEIQILSLPERWWKWRMYGGAITLAKRFRKNVYQPDLVIASSMLDLSTFRSLSGLHNTPFLLYFHENQFAYPERSDYNSREDNHYRFLNYTSALCADAVAFNSKYNRDTFFTGLENMLRTFPEYRNMETIDEIKKKSTVLPLGFSFDDIWANKPAKKRITKSRNKPVILWNHRWEHDKNPEEFFRTLEWADEQNLPFQLIVAGQAYAKVPPVFKKAQITLKNKILHFGYAGRDKYLSLLQETDLLLVTSHQDFFGISVVEAAFGGAFPLLPNRLAYPEIIPRAKFPGCYYDNIQASLKKYLTNFEQGLQENQKTLDKLRKHLYRYDWKNLANKYESVFHKILDKKN